MAVTAEQAWREDWGIEASAEQACREEQAALDGKARARGGARGEAGFRFHAMQENFLPRLYERLDAALQGHAGRLIPGSPMPPELQKGIIVNSAPCGSGKTLVTQMATRFLQRLQKEAKQRQARESRRILQSFQHLFSQNPAMTNVRFAGLTERAKRRLAKSLSLDQAADELDAPDYEEVEPLPLPALLNFIDERQLRMRSQQAHRIIEACASLENVGNVRYCCFQAI